MRRDFEAMAEAGANALRTYVPPPLWLLDLAQRARPAGDGRARLGAARRLPRRSGLAGGDRRQGRPRRCARARPIRRSSATRSATRSRRRSCAGTASARSSASSSASTGRRRRRTRRRSSPTSTTPRPSTSSCRSSTSSAFNVFLEDEDAFEAYLARLQNLSGDRPLLITEVGLDSRRNGEEAQAEALDWQVRHAFATGARRRLRLLLDRRVAPRRARRDDWDFGLVDRERRPKPALAAVRERLRRSALLRRRPLAAGLGGRLHPQRRSARSPSASTGCAALELPGLRGDRRRRRLERRIGRDRPRARRRAWSRPSTAASAPPATPGSRAATGEIVAFLDDDAYPDPDWLHYLAAVAAAQAATPGSAGRTSRPTTTAWSPNASRPRPAGRSTS